MTPRFNRALLLLLLAFGIPFYWLMLDNGQAHAPATTVTTGQLRGLAAQQPGARPTGIAVERVARKAMTGSLLAAGTGMRWVPFDVMSFRLQRPQGEAPIVIDSGMSRIAAEDMDRVDRRAQTRINAALRAAGLILLTSQGPEHASGLAALPPRIRHKAELGGGGAPAAVAPGVVVVPTPDRAPGSQMIYVQLADGREFLFAGDAAPLDISWREGRTRARLLTDYLEPENRAATFAWLDTIAALKRQAPSLHIVAGHDPTSAAISGSRPAIAPRFPNEDVRAQAAGK